MKSIRGNLLALARSGRFDVIVHGCNCRHAMDAGIAKQIKAAFPEAYAADLATPKGAGKLGTISTAEIQRAPVRFPVATRKSAPDWPKATGRPSPPSLTKSWQAATTPSSNMLLGAVDIWCCGGFCAIKQHLPRCKSSQGVQPCCGLRLASAAF